MHLEANQYQLGKEYALKLDGFTAGASVAIGAAASGVARLRPPPGPALVPRVARSPAPPADMPDACAGKPRCYGAGPFIAEVTQVTTSKVTYYVYVHLNVKVLERYRAAAGPWLAERLGCRHR